MLDKKVLKAETVNAQASPSFTKDSGITPLGIYLAIREEIELTHTTTVSATNGQSWQTKHTTTDVRYLVIDNNDKERSFGGECFRIV